MNNLQSIPLSYLFHEFWPNWRSKEFLRKFGFCFWQMKSSKCFRLINIFKVPKIPFMNRSFFYLYVVEFKASPLKHNSDCARYSPHTRRTINELSFEKRTVFMVHHIGMGLIFGIFSPKSMCQSMRNHQRGFD